MIHFWIGRQIADGDGSAFLKELPFIGAKTSERIVTELRGKMAKFALARTEEPLSVEREPASELKQEARQVLEQLEYSRTEAMRMVEEIFAKGGAMEALLEMKEQKVVRHLGITGHYRPAAPVRTVAGGIKR